PNPVSTGTVYIGRSRPTEARGRHSALVPIGRGRGGQVQTGRDDWTAVTQVPAIISQEQCDLVQTKLAHNQQFARRNNTAYPYLLRAMVSCGICRLGCNGRRSRGGYAYYVCVGKSHGTMSHRDEKCSARSIPVEQLDELVWQDVCEMLLHPNQIATALYRAQGGQWLPQELQARRENLRKARVSLEQQMERLTDAYLANVLQLDEYKRRRQELEQRLSVIAEQKRQLEAMSGIMTNWLEWPNRSKPSASACNKGSMKPPLSKNANSPSCSLIASLSQARRWRSVLRSPPPRKG